MHPHHHHTHDAAFWDQMYRNRTAPWDEEPNPLLARAVEGLAPGTALDVACGEGSDALWLARRGWRVTAVDLSEAALDRARAADAEGHVSWRQADLLAWQPPAGAFDLVSMHFLHFSPEHRGALFAALASAVRPGGMLLVVAHHASDLETSIGRWPMPDLYFTAEDVAGALEEGRWEVLFGGTVPREAKDPQGRLITIQDAVLKARRTS